MYSNKLVYYIVWWRRGRQSQAGSYHITYQNQIDIVNADLQLSELKHHLILRKVFLPQDHAFPEFAHNLYKYFSNVNLECDSICFVQIETIYDNSFYDILVGFKRDTDAFSVFRVSPGFNFMNQDIPIELT